mgnify:CR=1 FL=1|tara:strand:- start:3359 stop:3550 length:192 start_codon:yes stop_codon:yes gene_type:complete
MDSRDALAELQSKHDAHQQECALRYQMLESRLERGSARFARIEAITWSLYPFILASVFLARYL